MDDIVESEMTNSTSASEVEAPEYISEDLRTRPVIQTDRPFWYTLHQSSSACSTFRDGKTRTPSEVDPQFDRSILRSQNKDPRYLHVIEQLITDEWIPVGTVVLGGSDEPDMLECAILSHIAFDVEKKTYVDLSAKGDAIFPISANENALKILVWGLKEYVPYIK